MLDCRAPAHEQLAGSTHALECIHAWGMSMSGGVPQESRLLAVRKGEEGEALGAAAPSMTHAYRLLKAFAARWRARGQPPLTILAFDVSKAFDNVDVGVLKQLLQRLVRSEGWQLRRLQTSVWARGQLVTRRAL